MNCLMNSSLFSLFKVSLKQTFDFRGKNKKNVAFLIPILLIIVFGCLISGIYAFLFSMMLREAEQDLSLVVYTMSGIASLMILSTAVPKVKGTLFGGKDYEMLAALPIRKSFIITVKFLSVYFSELLFSFVLVIPAMIVGMIMGGPVTLLLDGILLFLFCPLLPLIFACFIGMLIGAVADRFRFGNLITVILYLVFLFFIMYVSFTFSSADATEDLSETVQSLEYITWVNPATRLLMLKLPVLNYILYLIIHIVIFVLLSWIVGTCYEYFHALMSFTGTHQKYIEKETKQKGQLKALFTMDMKRYFSSKSYLINTITGGILSVVLVSIMIVIFYQIEEPEAIYALRYQVAPFLPLMILWCSSLAIPSSVAITMEGKNFWQVKTYPVDYKTYSYSKILLSELIMAPFILISSIILLFYIELTAIHIITTILLPQLYFFAMNCMVYFINMHFYTFKWENETKAVKQSSSVLLSMVLDFLGTIVIAGMMIALGIYVSYLVAALLTMLICLLFCCASFFLVQKKCNRLIHKIEI